MRIHNFGDLDEEAIACLSGYVLKSPEEAIVRNERKNQYVFETKVGGRRCMVKIYFHRTLKHRLASFFGHGNADRYAATADYLLRVGQAAPRPMLLLKQGRGLLPEVTLYAMERVEGRMLFTLLEELENDPERIRILAKKIVRLIFALKNAAVIHRDLNTKNFLISEENDVTLIDFDASGYYSRNDRRVERRHERDVATFLATCRGAPRFAAAIEDLLKKR